MCSLGNHDDASASFIPKEDTPIGATCIKCRQSPSIIVLRSKDAYCKECFLKGTIHKFKSLLGKHKLIKPNDKVLIVYDGNESATAMLHFIRSGLDLENPKRLKFEPVIIFIEPNQNLTIDARKEKFYELTKTVAKQNFQLYFASFNDYLENSGFVRVFKDATEYLERSKIDSSSLKLLENTNLSNRNLIEEHIRREYYIELAKKLECKFCFTSELILDVAATIISNITLGRGNLLPMDVGTFDNRDPHVTIIRPMRFFDTKEVNYYNNINSLKTVDLKHLYPKNTVIYDSIQNLTQNFVGNLQENYPATINTIVRTGDKLGIQETNEESFICKLCKCPIENNLGILSSNEATKFSQLASTQSNITVGQEHFNLQSTKNYYCFSCDKISNK